MPAAPAASAALLVALSTASFRLDIRYAGSDNFVGRPVRGYKAAKCLLTPPAAAALERARASLARKGRTMVVYDCYRPQKAVDDFVAWAKDLADQRTKERYYPRVDKTRLFAEGYIAEKSGHSRGSTVDVGLLGVDFGTPYDFFDPLSHTDSRDPAVSSRQRANRRLLKSAMEAAGFKNLPEEWWHYTLKDEPFPDRWFDLDVE